MKKILREIQEGQFAKEFILEAQAGFPVFKAKRKIEAAQTLETVGKDLRALMPWLKVKMGS